MVEYKETGYRRGIALAQQTKPNPAPISGIGASICKLEDSVTAAQSMADALAGALSAILRPQSPEAESVGSPSIAASNLADRLLSIDSRVGALTQHLQDTLNRIDNL